MNFELDPLQASLQDFAEHLDTLSIDEFETCVNGLKAYEKAIQSELDITQGRIVFED